MKSTRPAVKLKVNSFVPYLFSLVVSQLYKRNLLQCCKYWRVRTHSYLKSRMFAYREACGAGAERSEKNGGGNSVRRELKGRRRQLTGLYLMLHMTLLFSRNHGNRFCKRIDERYHERRGRNLLGRAGWEGELFRPSFYSQ